MVASPGFFTLSSIFCEAADDARCIWSMPSEACSVDCWVRGAWANSSISIVRFWLGDNITLIKHTHIFFFGIGTEKGLKFRELFTNYLRFYIFLTHIYCCNFPAIASYGNESNLFGRMTISLLPLPLRIYMRARCSLCPSSLSNSIAECWTLFPRLVRMHRPTINNVCDVPEMRCEKKIGKEGQTAWRRNW